MQVFAHARYTLVGAFGQDRQCFVARLARRLRGLLEQSTHVLTEVSKGHLSTAQRVHDVRHGFWVMAVQLQGLGNSQIGRVVGVGPAHANFDLVPQGLGDVAASACKQSGGASASDGA